MDSACSSCDYRNPLGARFCSSCGSALGRGSVDDPTAALEHPIDVGSEPTLVGMGVVQVPEPGAGPPVGQVEAVPMLVVHQGPKAGSRIHLDADVVRIGRHPESDIFLDDITVSRRHAEIRREAQTMVVVDAGSLNGTYINQERVEQGTLKHGDELQVGKFKLVYLASSAQS